MSPAMDYLDFDLEVGSTDQPGRYTVNVVASPRGEASGAMTFPYNADALENVILKLGRTRSGVRTIGSPSQQLARQFGTSLYDALFAGEVGTCFRRSLDEADATGKGLRVRLRLGRAPQLADVPWEYLYPSGLRQFLVLSTKTPVVRYMEQPRPVQPLTIAPPLQVLVVVAAPTNLATLDVDAEVQRIRTTLDDLEQAGMVKLTVVPNATLAELRRAMRRGTYHVLHFIGHGGFNPNVAEGMLAFEDDNHLAHMVSGTDLATMIHDHTTLRLVLLNACEGARQSPADPLGGVAQSLVAQGIPAVVAMQFEITDVAATVFSAEFYAALADGYPIDAALAEARVAVFSDDNDVEWGTPVLYLRASDGHIFDLAGEPTPAATGPADTAAGTSAPSGGARVVPVVVPPWPLPGGDQSAAAGQAAAGGTAPSAPSGPPDASGGWSPGPGTGGNDVAGSWTPGPGEETGAGEWTPGAAAPDRWSPGGGGVGTQPSPGWPTGTEPAGGRTGPSDPDGAGAGRDEGIQPGGRGRAPLLIGVVATVVVIALGVWAFLRFGPGLIASPSTNPSQSTSSDAPTPEPSRSSPVRTTSAPPTTPPTPIRTLPPVREVAALEALRGSVAIDGSTGDWQWQLVARANQRIAGASTATGDIYLMWDDDALYLLALVTDASPREPDPKDPNRVFRGDSVILELGPDKNRLKPEDLARPTDAYYMFGVPSPNGLPLIAILGPNAQGTSFEKARDPRTLDAAIVRNDAGYVLEARIPWKTTGLNAIGKDVVLAANVQVSERQNRGFGNLGMMSTNPQRTAEVRAHPAYWQSLVLRS